MGVFIKIFRKPNNTYRFISVTWLLATILNYEGDLGVAGAATVCLSEELIIGNGVGAATHSDAASLIMGYLKQKCFRLFL